MIGSRKAWEKYKAQAGENATKSQKGQEKIPTNQPPIPEVPNTAVESDVVPADTQRQKEHEKEVSVDDRAGSEQEKNDAHPESVVEGYAQATLILQDMLKQKVKKPDVVRNRLDERLYTYLEHTTEDALEDLREVRKLLESVDMIGKNYDFDDEELKVLSDYLHTKKTADSVMDSKLTEVREKLKGGDSEENIEATLDTIQIFENKLLDEEVRLRENMRGNEGLLEHAKKGWKRLGDMNLAILLSKKMGYEPKNTLLGKIGYGALRAMSLRTVLAGALVPLAGFGAGASGIAVAIGVKRMIGALTGASAGHALTKAWLEKEIKGKVDKMSTLQTSGKGNYEQVIQLKKEYDAFIKHYHADTADTIRDGAEYKAVQNLYRDAIKDSCKDAKGAEDLRMKQNLSEVKARNIIKRNKKILFSGAIAGGMISAFVTPKIFDVASGYGKGFFGGGVDSEIGNDGGSTVKPQNIPGSENPAIPSESLREGEGGGSFEVVHEDGKDDASPPLTSGGETEDIYPDVGGVEFDVHEGVYTVQDGNWLSTIWLNKNDGNVGQMHAVMDMLRDLQNTEGGLQKLKEFGISSGDIEVIYPGDEVNTNAIQEWFESKNLDSSADTDPVQSVEQDAVFEYDEQKKIYTIKDAEKFDKESLEYLLGVKNPLNAGTSLPTTEGFKNFITHGFIENGDQILIDADEGVIRLLDAKGEQMDEIKVFEDATSNTAQDGDVESAPVAKNESGVHTSSQPENTIFEKNIDVVYHTITGEHNVEDVLKSIGVNTDTVPENILEKQVYEGHEVQVLTAKEGGFAGAVIDGEHLLPEQEVVNPIKMDAGEVLPFTGTLEDLVETAKTLNVDVEGVLDNILITRAGGEPIMSVVELQQFRPNLFEGGGVVEAKITGSNDEILIETDYPPQKRFLIETNEKGNLNHDHIQKEFEDIQKTLKNPKDIHLARQDVIKKSLTALTIERPPADIALFDTLTDHLSTKIEGDADLTDAMFSEKGWGDTRVRFVYSEDQKQLEIQERVNINKGKRYVSQKWEWKSILVEKVVDKK